MPARGFARRRKLLKRGLHLLDRRFLHQPYQYMTQAILGAITLAVLVAVEDALTNTATVTAITSSAFIVFMAPHSKLARPRRVLRGHASSITIGLAGFFVATEVLGGSEVAVDLVARRSRHQHARDGGH